MNEYLIFWKPSQQTIFLLNCPFINANQAEYFGPSIEWPEGYFQLYQYMNNPQFNSVDSEANAHRCMDIKPAQRPAGSPTQR